VNPHHHLHESTLMSYAAGALPAPLSVVAGAHLEQCPHCRQRLREAEAIGSVLLEQTQPPAPDPRGEQLREAMLMRLATETPITLAAAARPAPSERPEADPDHLPASLHPYFGASLSGLRWRWMAPMHSHGRSELTQILRGSYNDALGLFAPGDVADLDEDVEHQPVTAPGVPCICVSALDAPLVFSGWLARKIQRFVKL